MITAITANEEGEVSQASETSGACPNYKRQPGKPTIKVRRITLVTKTIPSTALWVRLGLLLFFAHALLFSAHVRYMT